MFKKKENHESEISKLTSDAIGEKQNQIDALISDNNVFVMKLNDSMTRIGDSSCVKEMIEQVNSQTTAINEMKDSSQNLGESIQNIQNAAQNIQKNSHDVIQNANTCMGVMKDSIRMIDDSSKRVENINEQVTLFREKAIKIHEIIDMVKKIAQKSGLLALNASIEAARAGEAGRGFAVVANQIKELSANTTASAEDVVKYVDELMDGISSLADSVESTTKQLGEGNASVHKSLDDMSEMTESLHTITKEIDGIYDEINNQSSLTRSFVTSIDSIAASYDTLSQECVDTGAHLYRISRDVDKTRSDMARKNSKLTTLDWIKVFEVDHLIFTWRLYNNLADFETLQLTQVNNPQGCKFGKWVAAQTNPQIVNSRAFRQAVDCHNELHKYACDSWHAKDSGDREGSLRCFMQAYETYKRFQKILDDLRDVIRQTGDDTVTAI